MQLRCIRDFSQYKPGDTETVPDGAAFDPFHWEAVDGATGTQAGLEADAQAGPPAPAPVQFLNPDPKEM